MFSQTEENYLKAIFNLSKQSGQQVSTNAISREMNTSAASVTDMLKRLAEKNLINYQRYKGVTLTESGNQTATFLIRKHRLWEVFLVEKLHFGWEEVHDIAEELEHIQSETLIDRLDHFLDFPKFDPHGDPIPDRNGQFTYRQQVLLSDLQTGDRGVIVGVKEHSTPFLQYLDRLELQLGIQLIVLEHFDYDGTLRIQLDSKQEHLLSNKVCTNLYVQKKN